MSETDRPFTLDDVLRLDEQVCFALYTATRLMTRLYQPVLAELGLTYPQYLVMLALWEADREDTPLSVSALGERLHLDSGTLTPLLKRLEGQGRLERLRDPEDERRVLLVLTPEGRALREPALAVPLTVLCKSGAPIPDVLELRDRLKVLIGMMES